MSWGFELLEKGYVLFDSRGLGGNDMEARGLEGLGTFESWGFGPEVDLIAFVDVGGFL